MIGEPKSNILWWATKLYWCTFKTWLLLTTLYILLWPPDLKPFLVITSPCRFKSSGNLCSTIQFIRMDFLTHQKPLPTLWSLFLGLSLLTATARWRQFGRYNLPYDHLHVLPTTHKHKHKHKHKSTCTSWAVCGQCAGLSKVSRAIDQPNDIREASCERVAWAVPEE